MEKSLEYIYNKIIKQSKKTFFFKKLKIPNIINSRLEIFKLNLIIVLWFMNVSNVDKEKIESLIKFFVKDLEFLLRESGEAESRIGRKTRKLTENFYGRLFSYSKEFDRIKKKEKSFLKSKLKLNFDDDSIDHEKLMLYVKKNIIGFSKQNKSYFLSKKFDFFL